MELARHYVFFFCLHIYLLPPLTYRREGYDAVCEMMASKKVIAS